ncbi:hypothetical protein HOF92_09430 [bacterium]|nr:hypothetical protein [bacterium]
MRYFLLLFFLFTATAIQHSSVNAKLHRNLGSGIYEQITVNRSQDGNTLITIALRVSFRYRQIPVDPIDLQIQASHLQHKTPHAMLDAGSSSIARMMWGFVPVQERIKFLKAHSHNSPVPGSLDSSELSDAFRASLMRQGKRDFRSWFFESQVTQEPQRVLSPGFSLTLRDQSGLKSIRIVGTEPRRAQVYHLDQTDLKTRSIPYHWNGSELEFRIKISFEPQSFSLGLINEDGMLIEHAGGPTPRSFRGAYLLQPNPDILPRVGLLRESNRETKER